MTNVNLWARLGSWINPFARDDELPHLARTDVLAMDRMPGPEPAGSGQSRSLFRSRRDEALDHLQSGYDKVLDLVESIQGHLARQNDRSDKVVHSLSELAQGVRDLPQAARSHGDTLDKVATQVEVSNSHAQVMIGVLRDWPSATAAQREALTSIGEHLRCSSEATHTLSKRLHALDSTVSTLGEAANEQIQTLKAMQRAARTQESQLVNLLTTQTRRFVMLVGVGVVLSVAALVVAGAALLP